MIKIISAQTLRARLGEIINEVYYRGHIFIVTRKGRPMVKLAPLTSKERKEWEKGR